MSKYLYVPAFAAILCAVCFLLYSRGIMVSKCVKAVLFLFRPGRDMDEATLDSCTGWVRHAGRSRDSRTYVFTLETQLSAGEAEVLLLDGEKEPLLRLDRSAPTGTVTLSGGSWYFLHWAFQGATGRCRLRWQPYSAL